MATQTTQPSPTEEAAEEGGKYLTILEHLQELRQRLTIAMLALVATTGLSFAFAKSIIGILSRPAEAEIADFADRLIFTEPLEFIGAYFRVSLLGGLTLAMPVIIYQVFMFAAPALTRQEKRWLVPIVVGAGLAFASGVAFAYFIALPPALDFLYTFGQDTAQPLPRLGPYIDFVTRLMVVVGLSFETPLVIMGMARLGLVTAQGLLRQWRYAVVGAFVISAVVTPTIDPITQSVVAGPIIVLYFAGVVLARLVERPNRFASLGR